MNKRIYRSRTDRIIAGVAGGLGAYFDVDPVIIRILFAVSIFAGGFGLFAYIICWIVMPEQPIVLPNMGEGQPSVAGEGGAEAGQAPSGEAQTPTTEPSSPQSRTRLVFGVVLIVLGGIFLLDNLISWFDFGELWPIILIAIGVAMLMRMKK